MKYLSYLLALVVVFAVSAKGQDETTLQPTEIPTEVPTSQNPGVTVEPTGPTVTPNPGQPYGTLCSGIALPCNNYGGSVGCFHREVNATTGLDECHVGVTALTGFCRCIRNCGTDGLFIESGEFDEVRLKCVGLVGKLCTIINPDCTQYATCNFLQSKCECLPGHEPTADGLRCSA